MNHALPVTDLDPQETTESLSAIAVGGWEKLDNLIFVVNCNLQRLDVPVCGNSKVIQELESNFRAAGWNVIKVIWGQAGMICWPKIKPGCCVNA